MKYGPYTTQNVTWDTVIFDGQTIFLAAVACDRPTLFLSLLRRPLISFLGGMARVLAGVLGSFSTSIDEGVCIPCS